MVFCRTSYCEVLIGKCGTDRFRASIIHPHSIIGAVRIVFHPPALRQSYVDVSREHHIIFSSFRSFSVDDKNHVPVYDRKSVHYGSHCLSFYLVLEKIHTLEGRAIVKIERCKLI